MRADVSEAEEVNVLYKQETNKKKQKKQQDLWVSSRKIELGNHSFIYKNVTKWI
jgi:hypothetical protein